MNYDGETDEIMEYELTDDMRFVLVPGVFDDCLFVKKDSDTIIIIKNVLDTTKEQLSIRIPKGFISCIKPYLPGKIILSTKEGSIYIYDYSGIKPVLLSSFKHNEGISALAVLEGGAYISLATMNYWGKLSRILTLKTIDEELNLSYYKNIDYFGTAHSKLDGHQVSDMAILLYFERPLLIARIRRKAFVLLTWDELGMYEIKWIDQIKGMDSGRFEYDAGHIWSVSKQGEISKICIRVKGDAE